MTAKLLVLAVCLFALGAVAQPKDKDSQMHLTVLDSKTSLPLPDVKVRAWSGSGLVTDAAGICSFPMPVSGKGRFYYRITLTKPGYVAKYITWSEAQKDKIGDILRNTLFDWILALRSAGLSKILKANRFWALASFSPARS